MEMTNTIKSVAVVKQLHLVSAGQIGGWPINDKSGGQDALLNTYVDDVPIKYWDGAEARYNTGKDIVIEARTGGPAQTAIPGFGEHGAVSEVGQVVTTIIPVARPVTALADGCMVTIGFNEGIGTQTNEGFNTAEVKLKIERKLNTLTTWETIHTPIYQDRSTSPVEESYRVDRPAGIGAWSVRVTRITPDSTADTIKDKLYFVRTTELYNANTNYDDFAIIGFTADGKSLNKSSIPTISFLLDGILIDVPSTYRPMSYDGTGAVINPWYDSTTWDGVTFKKAVCNNPVWIMYYFLTNPDNGLGDRVKPENIDIWGFYSCAKYCDNLLPVNINGVNTFRPRYTMDWQFTTRQDAYTILQEIAGAMNGTLMYGHSSIILNIDRPTAAERIITRDSVIDGKISWVGAATKDLGTQAAITWYNPLNNYRPEVTTVSADDYFGFTAINGHSYIDEYGLTDHQATALGCTNEAQAIRYGRWILERSLKTTEICKFKMGMNGFDIMPGQVVIVSDPTVTGVSISGRIITSAPTYILSSEPVTVTSGQTIWINKKDGGVMSCVVSSNTTNNTMIYHGGYVNGGVSDIGYATEFSTITTAPAMRVINVSREEGGTLCEVECRQYSLASYQRIDGNVVVEEVSNNIIPYGLVTQPLALKVVENSINVDNRIKRNIIVSWMSGKDESVDKYYINWVCSTGLVGNTEVTKTSFEIEDIPLGATSISVRAVGATGLVSDPASVVYTTNTTEASGSVLAPPSGIGVIGSAGGSTYIQPDLVITWDANILNAAKVIKDYKVTVQDTAGTLLRTWYVEHVPGKTTGYSYTYSFAMQVSDGGPRRAVKIYVQCRDANNKLSALSA